MMKHAQLFLLIWYFALGRDIYSFEDKGQCERLNKHYERAGYLVSGCETAAFPPKNQNQTTTGPNSPVIHGAQGDVNITIDGKKKAK